MLRLFQTQPGAPATGELTYRADLDGLRAIAVWSVIVFHLWRNGLAGGYLGVDIFFVLSGFLITSILWRDALKNQFSIVRFYDRRIRRIIPALIAVLAFTTVGAVVILLPFDLIGYGKSLLSSLAFVANVYFWRDTDYFGAPAETKPLLHLWSLGVEEQFYILFPWLIALLAKFRKSVAPPIIAGLIAASLLADVFLRANGGGSPAFYLLPTRIWELGIGGLLAVFPRHAKAPPPVAQAMSFGGIILVIAGIVFPHILPPLVSTAVVPAVGTAFIIFAGNDGFQPWVNRLLSTPVFVFFGLISYSLYLWHWPVIVLGQYYLVHNYTTVQCIVAFIVMNVAAYVSWRYIERPFRSKSMPIRKVRLAAGVGVAAMALVGGGLLWFDGLPWRLDSAAAVINSAASTNYRCAVTDFLPFGASRACLLNLPSRDPLDADMILVGNSHAQMYAPIVRDVIAARGWHGLLVPLNGCLPTTTVNIASDCFVAARQNLEEIIKLRRVHLVFIGTTWWHDTLVDQDGRTIDNTNNAALIRGLDDFVRSLQQHGKRVVLIGPLAEPGWNIASEYSRQLRFGHAVTQPLTMSAAVFRTRFATVFDHFKPTDRFRFIRPDTVECPGDTCRFIIGGRSLFADSGHVALAELYRFRPLFEAALATP